MVNIMKRLIILFLAVGFFFLAGVTFFQSRVPAKSADGGGVATSAVESEQNKSTVLEDPSILSQAAGIDQKAAAVAERKQNIKSAANPFRTFEENDILNESVRALSGDAFLRRRLVHASGKYPRQLFKETIRRTSSGEYRVESQVGMVADQIIVKLVSGATERDLEALAAKHDASIVCELALPGNYVLQLGSADVSSVDEALLSFDRKGKIIARTQPNHLYFSTREPSDPNWSQLWGMKAIDAPSAWNMETGDDSILVAVIDTGIDAGHQDLVDNMWENSGEIGTDDEGNDKKSNGLDDDGNGYVDDWHGWDFYNDDNNPADDHSHGTHCAGTIGAVGNNSYGVAGVCWDISLVGVKILGADGTGASDNEIVNGILYASSLGARVQNNSWGGYGSSVVLGEAIETINSNEVLFVAAAGNYNNNNDVTPFYPASYDAPNIIAVAATDENDALASFSHYGAASVDLAAPGVGILSTVPGDAYDSYDGTSMATPHVVGAAALLWSANPSLDYMTVKSALLNSVDKISSLNGKMVSGGRLNVFTMLSAALDSDGDGMPDDWELNYSPPLYTNVVDSANDPDNDHLSNGDEYSNGTDPTNPDTDGDSLVDGWEVTYGFSPLSSTGQLDSVERVGISTEDEAMDVVVVDGYAYVADGEAGLTIIDVSNPADPFRVGSLGGRSDSFGIASLDTDGFAAGVAVANGVAYVADGTNGLVVVDVSSPTDPQELAVYKTPGKAVRVVVQGPYVYIADGDGDRGIGGLEIVDVNVPSSPVLAGRKSLNGQYVYDVYVSGTSAYIVTDNNGVHQINVSTPSNPQLVASQSIGKLSRPNNYAVNGDSNRVYVASADGALSIFDMGLNWISSNPGIDTETTPRDVCVVGNFICAAEGAGGLEIFDAADINNPVQFIYYPTYGGGNAVFAEGNYVYLADGTSGLQIFRIAFDTDADGMLDSWEEEYFGSATNALPFADPDGDGISNWGEYLDGLIPTNSDQDADGLIDGTDEVQVYNTDPRTFDTDKDGLVDGSDEVVPVSAYSNVYPDIVFADANTNGFVDGEIDFGTDPLDSDTDNDGMPDGWEVKYGLNPLSDDSAADDDNDGLSNYEEYTGGTDPQNPDTDGDGMPDGWEVNNGLDPLVDDSLGDLDGDALLNLYEYSLIAVSNWSLVYTNVPGAVTNFFYYDTNGTPVVYWPGNTDPNDTDSDNDGLSDFEEVSTNGTDNLHITNPNDPDTDNDGLPDGWEFDFGQNLTVPAGDDEDSDGDGLTNGEEKELGTDRANFYDPIFVDDDGPNDRWPLYTGNYIGDPTGFGPAMEDGSFSNAYDSIQEAINNTNAVDGITILVDRGEYYGEGNYNIDTQGKALIIRGWSNAVPESALYEWAGSPKEAVINSLGASPAFTMSSGETTNTVLRDLGLTVTINPCTDGTCDTEHVVSLDNASPTIQNCWIFDARLNGVNCVNESSPVLVSNIIENVLNGIWCENNSSPEISACRIGEIGHSSAGDAGIGIYINLSDGATIGGDTVISNCNGRGITLVDSFNTVVEDTDVFGCSGGMMFDNSSPFVDRCAIEGNDAPNYYAIGGVTVIGAVISPLDAEDYADVTDEDENGGGILMLRGASPVIRNCLVAQNRTWAEDPDYIDSKSVPDYGLGGGLYIGSECFPTGFNCTVADNLAWTYGGGVSSHQGIFLRNMIFWGNTSSNAYITEENRVTYGYSEFRNIHCRSGSIDIRFSDIEFGYSMARLSTTNNPLFVGEGDYQLSGTLSPCFNTGIFIDGVTNDLDGVERPVEADWPDRVDMGCYEFADNDGDGMANEWERRYRPHLDPEVFDANQDPDGDGRTNIQEYEQVYNGDLNATDPTDFDSDNDGLVDGFDGFILTNSYPFGVDADTNGFVDGEMDGLDASDPNDPDTDNDGLTDAREVELGTLRTDLDSDDDGMPDEWESRYMPDLDPLTDDAEGDPDGDELTNLFEYNAGTNPLNTDSDGDGMPDKWEVNNSLDPADAGDADEDADGDGLSNIDEYEYEYTDIYLSIDSPTDPQDPDTDGDGVSDGQEVINGTNAHDPDDDGDGMPNSWEINYDDVMDPLLNDASADPDNDGLVNLEEYLRGTAPNDPDTDNDGVSDGDEVANGTNPLAIDLDLDSDGMPSDWETANGLDPLVDDALDDLDGDGLLNLYEYSLISNELWMAVYTNIPGATTNFAFGIPGSTDPDSVDTDNDGLYDLYEITTNAAVTNLFITNPNDSDTDDDGLPDGWEVGYLFDPTDTNGVNGASGDPDGDTLTNFEEYLAGSNPRNSDTDGDGIDDPTEIGNGTNPANRYDPMYVNWDGPGDIGEAGNPDMSDPLEDGTDDHPFDSIQEAINSSNTVSGMTILVADGIYQGTGNFNINPGGKDLIIRSVNGSANAFVITHGYGSGFDIISGETTNTLIQGFTIETAGDYAAEAGVSVSASSPILKDLVIQNCGCVALSCSAAAAPQVIDCRMSNSKMGISATGTSGLLVQNAFIYNTRERGIEIIDDDLAEITWSTVSNCSGGITLNGSDAEIRQCVIRDNEARNHYINAEDKDDAQRAWFVLNNENIEDKTDPDENGGGVLIINDSSPLFQNCLIVNNRTWADDPDYPGDDNKPYQEFGLGGGIYVDQGCEPVGVNCTVADNYASTLGGGIASIAGRPVFRNTIIWDNEMGNAFITTNEPASRSILNTTSSIVLLDTDENTDEVINIWYSNIEDGYSNSVFSIDADPQFVADGNPTNHYTLQGGSPCIDSGTYYMALMIDLAGNQRPTSWPDRVDMGCYEYGALPASDPLAYGAMIIQAEPVPDALTDTDGDGFTDLIEIALGTDRYSREDCFSITHDQNLIGDTALVAWQTQPGCYYTVQVTDSLADGAWVDVEGWVEVEGDGSVMTCGDTRTDDARFYRVLVRIP